MSRDACLTPDEVLAFFAGELDDRDAAALEHHADACPRCCELLAALARAGVMQREVEAAPTGTHASCASTQMPASELLACAEPPRMRRGTLVGRYRVLDELGAGGMGVVYAAHDPELDRTVAIKLLRAPARAGDHAHRRLQREAQALARLSHRNLVQVFDVGVCELADGRAISFVAMELIAGTTLRTWALQCPRSWPEVVRVYAEAARGLAAAHSAGVVHRDFKPSNVLIGLDGRVVVVDFGLARFVADEPDAVSDDGGTPPITGTDPRVTRSRVLVGTPAYMAPEQRAGGIADGRSDQYALCVAIVEALDPRRVGAADGLDRLRIPRALAGVLARGLAVDPAARFSEVGALVSALEQVGVRRRRRRWLAAGGAAFAIAAVGGIALARPAITRCSGGADRIADVWDRARADELATALVRHDDPHLTRESPRITARIDRYGHDWAQAHQAICDAAGTSELLDARMACLDRSRAGLDATLRTLEVADVATAGRAVDDIDALPDPARCVEDPVADELDPETRDAVVGVHAILAEARALERGGNDDAAAARYDDALALARRIGHPPTWAEASIVSGSLAMARGELEPARARLTAALRMAEDAGDDEHVARAAIELCWLEGYYALAFDLAEQHCEHAAAAIDHGGGDPALHALRERNLGWVALQRDRPADAERHFRSALGHLHQAGADDGRDALLTRLDLGNALLRLDRIDEAEQAFEAVRTAIEHELGSEHPELAPVLNNLGAVARMRGDYERAWKLFDRVIAVMTAAHGPMHIVVARALLNRGTVELDMGRNDDARATYTRAAEIFIAEAGPDHPELARVWKGIAGVDQQSGDDEAARRGFQRALDIEIQTLGADHLSVAVTSTNLATTLVDLGRPAEALPLAERALAILTATLGAEHPDVGVAQLTVGFALEGAGRLDAAAQAYARAIAIARASDSPDLPQACHRAGTLAIARGDIAAGIDALEQAIAAADALPDVDPTIAAQSRFALARVLSIRPGTRTRARELAGAAAAALAADDPLRREIDAWLAGPRARRPAALP